MFNILWDLILKKNGGLFLEKTFGIFLLIAISYNSFNNLFGFCQIRSHGFRIISISIYLYIDIYRKNLLRILYIIIFYILI
jgi:Purine-nucleoside phosphorylase